MRRLLLIFFTCLIFYSFQTEINIEREKDFNFDWRFTLLKDTLSSFNTPLEDSSWREIRLPHDWSIESSFDASLEGNVGYLPGGVAWYQKYFNPNIDIAHQKAYILFDGVYNNAKFWLNGQYLGENPYGYSPVYFDITDKLNKGNKENIISVYVDRSRFADSRWYPGSGIYRNVKLITTDKLHIPIWGTYITTLRISKKEAVLQIEVKVKNDYNRKSVFELQTLILNKKGQKVASIKVQNTVKPHEEKIIHQRLKVLNPLLWDIDMPNMYKAVTKIMVNNKVIDSYDTPFGIRKIQHINKKGLFVNGKSTLAKGVCLHHDGGLVGAAVPKEVWRRRLQLLKKGGVNAIRTAHNPFSQEFLDLCDEMGFLVQAEIFDAFDYPKDKRLNYHDRRTDYITRGYTEHFQIWGESDLTRTLLRDRNHPSIFEWSIGNEIEWTYLNYRYVTGFWKDKNDPQNAGDYWTSGPILSPQELSSRYKKSKKRKYILTETAEKINGWVKKLDKTRPTTANLVVPQTSMVSGYADAVDIVGFSYRNKDIKWAQDNFNHKQITINECPGTWEDWEEVIKNPGVYSMYMWTGIAYLGESNDSWPKKAWYGDMLNLAGFKNQGWNYFKSIFVDEPHISIGTIPLSKSGFHISDIGKITADTNSSYRWRNSNMHWNYHPKDSILVEVNTNQQAVELFINKKSLGVKYLKNNRDMILRWFVPFEKGELMAKVVKGNLIKSTLITATKPVDFIFTSDKKKLKADGYDVAHLVLQLIDEQGTLVKTKNKKVTFKIVGNTKLLGVDNGLADNIQDFQSNTIVTGNGQCLLIIQSIRKAGSIKVIASVEGLHSKTIEIISN